MKLDNFNTNATINVPVSGEVTLRAQHLEENSSDVRGEYSRNRTSRTVINGLEVAVKVTVDVRVETSISVAHAEIDLRDVGKMVDRVCTSVDRAIASNSKERRCDCKGESVKEMIADKVKTELRNQVATQLQKK